MTHLESDDYRFYADHCGDVRGLVRTVLGNPQGVRSQHAPSNISARSNVHETAVGQ